MSIFSTKSIETDGFHQPERVTMLERVAELGIMATGITHEFNNLLTVIQSSLEQLHRQPLDERGKKQLESAEWAARQAARLTQHVLCFGRPEIRQTRHVDLNEVVTEFAMMSGPAIPAGIRLVLQLAPRPLPVRLDPGQLELALLNLVRNAAHAMSGSGQIVIGTSGDPIDGADRPRTVAVSVCDTGCGMAADILQHAVDPFFTTKAPGKGTGLGLWMVRYFVTAEGGDLNIDTAEGRGTTIRLSFPRSRMI